MNQKGFADILLIVLVVAVVAIGGYFVLVKQPPSGTKSVVKIPSSPAKLSTSGAPAEPVDQALAEITVLSQTENGWKLHIDKIRDYIRYPAATNPQLKAGDTVSIRFNGWLDTFQYSEKVCPAGYIKSPKPAQAESATQPQPPATRPQPKITVGEKYLTKLSGCFAVIGGFDCGPVGKGWSGWFYNPYSVVIEYECVKPEPNITPPSVEPQR